LERAVADPVDGGAREEVVDGSIVDRAGVSEGWGHDAGRQHGGRQTDASLAGVSIECHLHLPSWLVLRAPPVRRLQTNEPGEDPFSLSWWGSQRMTHDGASDRNETSGSRGDEPPRGQASVVKRTSLHGRVAAAIPPGMAAIGERSRE